MNKLLWEIFKKTGDIKYYLLSKKLEGEAHETEENRSNSNKRKRI